MAARTGASAGALAWGAGRLAWRLSLWQAVPAEAKISADKSALDRVGFLIPIFIYNLCCYLHSFLVRSPCAALSMNPIPINLQGQSANGIRPITLDRATRPLPPIQIFGASTFRAGLPMPNLFWGRNRSFIFWAFQVRPFPTSP